MDRENLTMRNIYSFSKKHIDDKTIKRMNTPTSMASVPPRQRKITVVSIASNQHGLNIQGADEELRNRSVSTVRLDKVISEIKDFHSRTEMQLKKSVKKQAKELGWFFAIFVIYIMFGAFLFFYIEECSGSSVPNDGSVPTEIKVLPKHKNLTNTCYILYKTFLTDVVDKTNWSLDPLWNFTDSFHRFSNTCQRLVIDSALPVVTRPKLNRTCTVNEFMLLKYAEFTIFTLLTIGYGNTTPSTVAGRMCLIGYAVIGIPLAVTMYSVGGKLIVQIITLLIRMIHTRVYKSKSKEVTHVQVKTLATSISFMLIIMLVGCSITTSEHMEDLDFSSSFYFWFVSLTTIGYGDIHFARDKHLANPHLLILSAGNILFGLGIMAAIIEAFSLALEKKDLQMSTIIIDEDGFNEEVGMDRNGINNSLDVFRPSQIIDLETETETETNFTDLSSSKDSESNNSTINRISFNGHTNHGHTDDNGILLTEYREDEELANGNSRWKFNEPDLIKT